MEQHLPETILNEAYDSVIMTKSYQLAKLLAMIPAVRGSRSQ